MPTPFTDSHCHLELRSFSRRTEAGLCDEREDVLDRARQAGITRFIVIGSGESEHSALQAVSYATTRPEMFAAVGIHPHDAAAVVSSRPGQAGQTGQLLGEPLWQKIAGVAELPCVVAVGETGLDYHYNHSSKQEQVTLFRRFIQLSQSLKKPLVLHVREAHDEAMELILAEGGSPRGVVHCYTGGPKEVERWLRLGFHISLSGIVTFASAQIICEAAKLVPKGRLLLETDCPYLAPVPHRGKRNEPAFLVHTAAFVANLRGETIEELSAHTRAATDSLFGLPPVQGT